jgi:NAD+ kinase
MRIAINIKKTLEEHAGFVAELFSVLKRKNISFIVNEEINIDGVEKFNHQNFPNDIDYFLSIGGDGTLLNSVTYVGSKQIPILGINIGRLGFLTTATTAHIEQTIEQLQQKEFTIENRTLLRLESSTNYFDHLNFALNEVAILKQDSSSMISIKVMLDGEYLNTYWADGLVISTPTGSTGYSLSCGGPVVMPGSENFVISPVCPHNLNVRPLIINDNSILEISVEGRTNTFLLVLDSRSKVVTNPLKIVLRKEYFLAKIIKLEGYHYLNTLREKLLWGSDVRN